MKKLTLIAAIGAAFISISGAHAADSMEPTVIAKVEVTGSPRYQLAPQEFDTFKGLATPKPGKEGKEPKGIAEARGEWFKKLDANGDNSISADE